MMTGMSVYSVAWGKWGGVIRHVVAWAWAWSVLACLDHLLRWLPSSGHLLLMKPLPWLKLSTSPITISTLRHLYKILLKHSCLHLLIYDNQGGDEQSRTMKRIFIFKCKAAEEVLEQTVAISRISSKPAEVLLPLRGLHLEGLLGVCLGDTVRLAMCLYFNHW